MTMISTNCAAPCTAPLSRFSVLDTIGRFHGIWRQRRALKSLDSAALRDIGLTRAQATTEANRPVWDAPAHWHGQA